MGVDFKKTGFRFVDNNTIEFYLDSKLYTNFEDSEEIFVSGSFNDWLTTADSSWRLNRKVSKDECYYSLIKNKEYVLIPGNSGFPEFRFFAVSPLQSHLLKEVESAPEDYYYLDNKLIVTKDDLPEVHKINNNEDFYRSITSFDLTCPVCRSQLCNFRLVPGTLCLYRGYSPMKKTKYGYDTEDKRIEMITEAIDLYRINAEISLTGFESPMSLNDEVMSEKIEELKRNDNRSYVNMTYSLVYYHSEAVEFSNALRNVFKFIIDKEGPYYIHSRLGIDATGVVCALIEGLLGLSWTTMEKDFLASNYTGIREYRSINLLKYTLKKILGFDPSVSTDLSHQIQSYFIRENILDLQETSQLISKLQKEEKPLSPNFFDFKGHHTCSRID